MANILFWVNSYESHYNASYKVARILSQRGHSIKYIGVFDQQFKKNVLAQGFEFYTNQKNRRNYKRIFALDLNNNKVSGRKGKLNPIQEYIIKYSNILRTYNLVTQPNLFDDIIEDNAPDLFILDAFNAPFIPSLSKNKIPCIIFQSYILTSKDILIPPLNSSIIPKDNLLSLIVIEALWSLFSIKSSAENYFLRILYNRKDIISAIKKSCNVNGFPFTNNVEFSRVFSIGFKNVPEIVLSPKELDFPRKERDNKFFIGTTVDLERIEVSFDYKYHIIKESLDKEKNIVYCSLGTLGTVHYKNCIDFFLKIIQVFKSKPELLLILSVGNNINKNQFRDIPSNVHIFNQVPQIQLLKKVKLMITHGGIQSITECILLEVPMIVYPITSKWDQKGNAARVEYHKIGVRGNIKKDNEIAIAKKVDEVLNTPFFIQNIRNMNKKIALNNSFETCGPIIESFLAKR